MEELFRSYWWLIFPVGWMIAAAFESFGRYHQRSGTLKLLKTYAEQGKEPPQALLDMLKSDEQRAYDYASSAYGGYDYKPHGARHSWWQIVTFGALAVGFGYYGQYGGGHEIFTALALAFGVAALSLGVIAAIRALFGSKRQNTYSDKDAE
ncbi:MULTISPECIES: hypothetical protein [Asticcacaulis]|uniref:hypothetical protein n=1 Tax=Asticcacaulis TaxID=76890 RepID=UPI001AE477BE|nr:MULTISPECIES: hypothetical protein [Asticcacaulis]MBP2158535.1 hypothetical protein [Asticcacaulis solisilvae]MDR6799581.1 hypothetical protein [Asticcacaulis sp. BE141]